MDVVKINRNTPVNGLEQLNYDYVCERDNELVIKLNDNTCYFLDEGDKIYFNRTVRYEENGMVSFNDYSTIKYEDSDHILHATLPSTIKIALPENFFELKSSENGTYYIITCNSSHYMFPQDLNAVTFNLHGIGQEVYFKDYNGNLLGTYHGIYSLQKYRRDEGKPSINPTGSTAQMTIEDCLTSVEYNETCGKNYDYIETRHYNFFPESESTTEFILTDFNELESSGATYIEFKYNPYYFYRTYPNDKDSYGNSVKHCCFYGDSWFDSLIDTTTVKYANDGFNNNSFCIDKSYYSVSLGLSNDANETNLGTEDLFSETFAEKIEESLIPDFIDMERVKYSPYEVVSSVTPTYPPITSYTYLPLTSITIYNHFRERVKVDPNNNNNTLMTSGNVYEDGWYIDPDENYNIYWNNYEGSGNPEDIQQFVEQSGMTSDLIGFLNFTDNDIFYRKSKVSKSFFRISFYDSNVPIEQKLLYYSTVFLDSGELFSKFLKQKSFIEDSPEEVIKINPFVDGSPNVDNVKVVFCENEDANCRVDTTIRITNEYDREKCSEGFNIYLFSDDIPEGNTEKTIYMKVEFNHAGNGKTMPMIVMPKEELTIENFIENLFIPITIKKLDDKYIYIIDGTKCQCENGDLKLCLFEPKLTIQQN